jgi:hypothetical protein
LEVVDHKADQDQDDDEVVDAQLHLRGNVSAGAA